MIVDGFLTLYFQDRVFFTQIFKDLEVHHNIVLALFEVRLQLVYRILILEIKGGIFQVFGLAHHNINIPVPWLSLSKSW